MLGNADLAALVGLRQALHRQPEVSGQEAWTAQAVLAFVSERGTAHPREVDAHFGHGKTTNWFGGSSNASTQLLDGMHYRGLLRVARELGVEVYEHSPMQRLEAGQPARVQTPQGEVRARKVVLAAAIVITLVASIAIVFPWVSDADPNALSISERLRAPSGTMAP